MKTLMQSSKTNSKKKNDDMKTEHVTDSCIKISDININDIEENINDENKNKEKKKGKAIEYYLFDVESYNSNNNTTLDSFVDLSSIRSSYLSENRKKKAKKKKGSYIKKQLKIYKKKYKILPEHNLDQDTNYEESIKTESKDYSLYELKEIKEDKGINDFIPPKRKDIFNVKKDVFVNVIFFSKMKSSTNLTRKEYIKYIISISALLGLSVVTGNSAYSYLEIPVISVIKSSSLILIYFLSIKFGLKEFKCSLLFSILTILMGVIMSITTLKIDSLFGVFLLVISVIASSFKWVFTNVLLRSTSMKPHIILLHIYQVAMLIINYNSSVLTVDQILSSLMLVAVGALTTYTSSVTLSIVFIGREAIILIIGSIFFGENVNMSSSIGIAISMIGTILYGYASK
ncbi:triose or hexose phosphate/phosphate translocator, putative [Plasmodium ovale wallikeri]|uniref:Triose or hexose phosphate/phosphate translocator, putative n=1 Tax=Plasmodium ovale wallikeri TaxID=864142 RepID=A0A1A8ZYN5_PLAOA|nr:triose or hexose phosphate/phosphate translocator, putative [Plasmodium ovale wallikeri]SBT49049.1 triose or hexose phosphate/phosphate translocator, putative [Plasmodium ovale wallikeri]